MKLLPNHNSLLKSVIYPISILFLLIIIFCKHLVLYILITHWLFLICTLIIFFCPISKNNINPSLSVRRLKTWQWLFAIWIIQGLFFFASYTSIFAAQQLFPANSFGISYIQNIFTKNYGLFPLGFITLLTLSLSYFCYNRKQLGVISSTIQPLFKNTLEDAVGIYADGSIRTATLVALAITLSMCILLSAGLIMKWQHFPIILGTKISVIFAVSVALFSLNPQLLTNSVRWLRNYKIPYLFILAIFLLFLVFIILIVNAIAAIINDNFPNLRLSYEIFSIVNTKIYTEIFVACWWLAWCPVIAGILAYISQGYSWRQFIIASLILPIIFGLMINHNYFGFKNGINANLFSTVSLLSAITIIFFLLKTKYISYLMRSTLPETHTIKPRNPQTYISNLIYTSSFICLFYCVAGIPIISIPFFIYIAPAAITIIYSCISLCFSLIKDMKKY